MNQLEFFVASTECDRWQARRCLRAVRTLDERIEYSLGVLHRITEYRSHHLASSSAHGSGAHVGRSGRKRGRSPDRNGAHTDDTAQKTSSGESHMAALKAEYDFHRTMVMRLARDRANYAKLLGECGDAMRRCAATRLLQFQQLVDGEKRATTSVAGKKQKE